MNATTNADVYLPPNYISGLQLSRPVIVQVVDPSEKISSAPIFFKEEFDNTQTTNKSYDSPVDGYSWEDSVKWGGLIRSRFEELSLKDALSESTPDEIEEFNHLLCKRRSLNNPRSMEEIERDIINERALRKVTEGLTEYVRFL